MPDEGHKSSADESAEPTESTVMPLEMTEEEKVAELFNAYLANGREGILKVLKRRDEEYMRKQQRSK